MLQCYNVTFCCLLCRLGVVDAVLVTYPFHCFWREHLTPVPYTQTGEMVLFVVEPTSEGVHAHSGSCSELVFVHRFHDAKVLKIFELCKKFLDIFRAISINKHQKTPETGKEHQRLRQLSYLCTVFKTHREYWQRLGIEKGPFSALGLHNTCTVNPE